MVVRLEVELILSKVAMEIREDKVIQGVNLSHNKVDMEDNNQVLNKGVTKVSNSKVVSEDSSREVMVPKGNLRRELQVLIKE